MPTNRSLSFFALLIFSSCLMFAQKGGPLLSHYRESSEIENQSWAICQDENNVMMFANIRGILTFDGQVSGNTFGLIRMPVIPYSLKYNSQVKKVYVGGDNDYGYLQRDEKGLYKFVSMRSDTERIGIISKIVFTDSTVWFYGEHSISRHQLNTGKLMLRLGQKEGKPFTGMFVTPKNVFINVMSKGLYRLESDTLFPIVTGYLLENIDVMFSLPYDNNMVLLGLGDGSLSLFDGIKFYPYQVKDEGYLKDNTLSEGIVVSDSLYAFATLDGGAMVVERKSGKVRYTINYVNGLPDDEIFAIGSDNSNGLWLSHQYGLTRAELMLPVASLGVYPGLKGNLINPLWHNNELYVATSEGVFYLAEVKNYSDAEVLVKLEQPAFIQEAGDEPVKGQNIQQEVKKSRRSIFSKIFGKKYVPETQENPSPSGDSLKKAIVAPKTVYVKKKVSRLKSIDYIFTKVEGLTEKCRQLISTPGGIIASTNKGVYIISDHRARILTAGQGINFISSGSGNTFYAACTNGYFLINQTPTGWEVTYPDKNFNQPLYSVVSLGNNTIWAGSDDRVIRISLSGKPEYHTYPVKADYPQRCRVNNVNDTLFIFTDMGVSYYDPSTDGLRKYPGVSINEGQRFDYFFSQSGTFWYKHDGNWIRIGTRFNISDNDLAILKVFDNIISIYTTESDLWVTTAENQLFRIARNKIGSSKPYLSLFIRSIQNEKGMYFNISHVVFESGDNNIYFDIVAPGYHKKNSVLYQYTVEGMMTEWSKWSTHSTINLLLPHGTYTLRVRAKDIWGNVSDPRQLTFTIKTPFIQTTFFLVLLIILALMILILVIRFRERHLQHEKHILEEKVTERTAEIEAQKQEITSSIEYASRIQIAMLPVKEILNNTFTDHFVFYKPRDIVSGDFFWLGEDSHHIYFTVADCTGHGVPGAFMSTLGISTLNEIITNKSDLHANTVLNLLRAKIKTSLHQTGKEGEAADGMDIAFCILDKRRRLLEYSGAYNPLFIYQGGVIKEYKADRMPIGIYVGEKDSFTNFEINVNRGDILYLFSDGFADQFGGPDGSKYKKAPLKKFLGTIADLPMEEQGALLEKEFEMWRGKGGQIDDITFLGIKI